MAGDVVQWAVVGLAVDAPEPGIAEVSKPWAELKSEEPEETEDDVAGSRGHNAARIGAEDACEFPSFGVETMGRKSRLKRQRRALRESGSSNDSVRAAVAEPGHPPRYRKKLSEALSELLRPHVEDDMDLGSYDMLVGIAVLAWNRTITDAPVDDLLAELHESLDEGQARFLRSLLVELSEQKQRLFPQDDRVIVSWNMSPTPTGFYLEVASARNE